jgi:hypothetical protein
MAAVTDNENTERIAAALGNLAGGLQEAGTTLGAELEMFGANVIDPLLDSTLEGVRQQVRGQLPRQGAGVRRQGAEFWQLLPRHATPRHTTPRHATPRHATPRHATQCVMQCT